jgi:hypothetical protein
MTRQSTLPSVEGMSASCRWTTQWSLEREFSKLSASNIPELFQNIPEYYSRIFQKASSQRQVVEDKFSKVSCRKWVLEGEFSNIPELFQNIPEVNWAEDTLQVWMNTLYKCRWTPSTSVDEHPLQVQMNTLYKCRWTPSTSVDEHPYKCRWTPSTSVDEHPLKVFALDLMWKAIKDHQDNNCTSVDENPLQV